MKNGSTGESATTPTKHIYIATKLATLFADLPTILNKASTKTIKDLTFVQKV